MAEASAPEAKLKDLSVSEPKAEPKKKKEPKPPKEKKPQQPAKKKVRYTKGRCNGRTCMLIKPD